MFSLKENQITDVRFSERNVIDLKNNILIDLENCGFTVNGENLEHHSSKEDIRKLHQSAVKNMRSKYRDRLKSKEYELVKHIANGEEITPENIDPKLILVDASSKYWDLFNYIKIHWSIPISNGYGRRLCYIIFDKNNDKVIGIIGLADPVFSTGVRDNYIGWDTKQKKKNMCKIMDGFVIGSVPPYNFLLGGKLVASMLFSNQIRKDFKRKYGGSKSLISGKVHSGDLVLLTTLSALGKSAIYDRIKLPNGQKYISTGFSEGWGEFHFNGKNYENMKKLVNIYNPPSRKKKAWGVGFRNKREVVEKSLRILNIPKSYSKHNVKREQFLIPLTKNYHEALTKNKKPIYYNISIDEISKFMKRRWVVPRAKRRSEFKNWKRENYKIWM